VKADTYGAERERRREKSMSKKILMALVIFIGVQLLLSFNTVTSVLPKTYNPSAYNLLGSTAYVSGALSDLQTNNGAYMTFRSYVSASDYVQVTYVSAGAGAATTTTTPLNVPFPSGLQADDLLLMQITIRDLTNAPTTPSGWTLLYGPDATTVGRQWIFSKFATGSETGNQAVGVGTANIVKIGRMYAFRNVALSSFTEGGGFGSGTVTTISAQSVTTTGVKRLAVSFVFVNDDNAVGSFTGETGGDWTEQVAEFTTIQGSDGCVQLQGATMASAGTISGGSYTMSAADPWGVRAFALVPRLVSEYTVELEFTGSSNTETWTQLLWVVDSAWTNGSVSVTLQLYNYTLGSYPTSGDGYIAYTSSSTANFDETKSQTITTNPADFRNATGHWTMKMKGVKLSITQFDFKADFVKYESTGVNQPPVLDPIGSKSVDELSLLTFTATASDPDIEPLFFSLGPGAPAGASIGATTGVFTWTPTEAQGPDTHIIRVIVSDGSLEDYEDISVTVNEINSAPILNPVGDKSGNELELLTFTATASDPDIPAQTLIFSLGAGAPEGASITSAGVFTWTPTEAQGPNVYPIRIIVSDGLLEDYEDINVTVNEANLPPVLDPIGDKTVNELTLLTFTATASDPDTPAQALTFSLGAGAPTGASIDATTGVFTWTPTEAQGPGVYPIRIIVSDSLLGQDFEDISVTVNEITEHDVAVLSVTPSGTKVYEGVAFNVTVVVTNEAGLAETFDVSVFAYNVTYSLNYTVGTQSVTLAPFETKSLTFPWNTALVQANTVYTIEASAAVVPGETHIADNKLTDGTVRVKLMGDVNGDGIVDVFDLIRIGIAFGSRPGEPRWDPDADVNNDGIVDVFDLIKVGINFGRKAP